MEVETGLISDSYVEIKSGLSEGDTVYVAESSQSSDAVMMMPGGRNGRRPREAAQEVEWEAVPAAADRKE